MPSPTRIFERIRERIRGRIGLISIIIPLLFSSPLLAIETDFAPIRGVVLEATHFSSLDSLLGPRIQCEKDGFDPRNLRLVGYGGSSSNGNTHTYHGPGPACFTEKNRMITACIVNYDEKRFGVDRNTVISETRAAFKEWEDYVEAHGLQKNLPTSQVWMDVMAARGARGSQADLPPKRKPDVESSTGPFQKLGEIHSKCQGNEDLRIYLGVNDRRVREARKFLPEPWGLFHCDYPRKDGRGNQGILWIAPPGSVANGSAPDWTLPGKLRGVLVHLVGKIYGVGVVPGTIMREDLTELLDPANRFESTARLLGQIDQERVLYSDDRHPVDLRLTALTQPPKGMGYAEGSRIHPDLPCGFRALMGRDASGPISEELKLNAKIPGSNLPFSGTLTLADQSGLAGSRTFPIQIYPTTAHCPAVGEAIFLRQDATGSGSEQQSSACVNLGSITAADGSELPVLIEENSGDSRYKITLQGPKWRGACELFNYHEKADGGR